MDPVTPSKHEPDKVEYSDGTAFFRSINGLKVEQDVVEYYEGGVNDKTKQLPGKMKMPILLIVLGGLAVLAGGLIFLGELVNPDRDGKPTATPTVNPALILPVVTVVAPVEVQPSSSGCTCAGVDQICTQADGS